MPPPLGFGTPLDNNFCHSPESVQGYDISLDFLLKSNKLRGKNEITSVRGETVFGLNTNRLVATRVRKMKRNREFLRKPNIIFDFVILEGIPRESKDYF